jgi:hypothetical protein
VSDASSANLSAYDVDGTVVIPKRILFDGVYFHDIKMSRPSDHLECLHVQDADGLTIRNSRFQECDTFDALIMGSRAPLQNVLIENNWFEPSTDSFGGNAYYGLSIRSGSNVIIRNNTSTQAWAGPSRSDDVQNWVVANNIFPSGFCRSGIDFRNNLWIGRGKCSPSDRTTRDPRLGDGRAGDYHLAPGSPAIDAGDPRAMAADDFDRERRSRGWAPDIGADEY